MFNIRVAADVVSGPAIAIAKNESAQVNAGVLAGLNILALALFVLTHQDTLNVRDVALVSGGIIAGQWLIAGFVISYRKNQTPTNLQQEYLDLSKNPSKVPSVQDSQVPLKTDAQKKLTVAAFWLAKIIHDDSTEATLTTTKSAFEELEKEMEKVNRNDPSNIKLVKDFADLQKNWKDILLNLED